MKKEKFDLGSFIEKHRLWVGGGLIAFILFGAGILLWKENFAKKNPESRIANLESKISQLENERNKVQETITKQTSSLQNSNIQNQDQGQVAGASSEQKVPDRVGNDNGVAKSANKVSGKININTASETELDSLSGIGPTYAKRIVEYRNVNGGFKSIDEIKNVKGIGDKTFLKFKDNITI
ncbi:MAG: helix-hairpin-helix domain-containing protein [Patescibacteria group bacterium]|nr:helix-hairpin-helix domain-containing protein [Patescibacteria group bacterium]